MYDTNTFPIQNHMIQNLTLSKVRQDQHRVIISLTFAALDSQMLHAEFQDRQTSGSEE